MATLFTLEKPASSFKPLSAGWHIGRLGASEVRTFDGRNFNTGEPETQTKLTITFESETEPPLDNGDPSTGLIWLSLSFGERAHLTIFRERLLGRPLSPEEATDINDDIWQGKRVRILVKHKTKKNGDVYANLDATTVTPEADNGPAPTPAPQAPTPPAPVAEDVDDIPF